MTLQEIQAEFQKAAADLQAFIDAQVATPPPAPTPAATATEVDVKFSDGTENVFVPKA